MTGLLSAGAVAGVGMLLLASGHLFAITPTILAALLGIMTWQMLGVTICKLGADQVVMATCFGTNSAVNIQPVFYRRILPLAVAFLGVSFFRYSPLLSVLIFLSLLLDVASVIYQAKLAAELKSFELFFSNLLNYPIFLLLIFLVGMTSEIGLTTAVMVFLASSLARFVYLHFLLTRGQNDDVLFVQGDFNIGIYQGINFWIFRGAQIAIGSSVLAYPPLFVADLFFFWKGIELLDKVNTALFPLFFRIVNAMATPLKRFGVLTAISFGYCLMFFVFYFGSKFFVGKTMPSWGLMGLVANIAMVLPVNYLVFRMIRVERTKLLLLCGVVVCIISGLVFSGAVLAGLSGPAIVLLTPLQLCLMVLGLYMILRKVSVS